MKLVVSEKKTCSCPTCNTEYESLRHIFTCNYCKKYICDYCYMDGYLCRKCIDLI
jgi:hypothetical protein